MSQFQALIAGLQHGDWSNTDLKVGATERARPKLRHYQLRKTQVAALLAKTASADVNGAGELYKTSHQFDGTYHNPQWLG